MAENQGDHDRVVIASRKPDGTPDQTPDFEFIGNKQFAIEATKEQLRQQSVSAVDADMRGVTADESDGDSTREDPTISKLQKAHESAAKSAEKRAEAEVNKLHQGLGDNGGGAVLPAGSTDKATNAETATSK